MKVEITGEFIKLSQFLKIQNFIQTGGAAKEFIQKNKITINEKEAEGRGSKIKPGDTVWVEDQVFLIIKKQV